jgi:hypothetical protein
MPEITHYLLTLELRSQMRMHCYLMCDDKRYVESIINQMVDKAKELGFQPFGIGLATKLSTGIDLVRKIVGERSSEAKHCIETATDFHFSMWLERANDPDDKRLMALH